MTDANQGSKSSSGSSCDSYLKSGYSYGEIGTYIVSQVLCKLFPDDIFLDDCTSPLSITDFRWKVLLPEAAAKLIMEDTHVDHHTAVRTMRRSARYGTATFPYDDQDVYGEMVLELLSPCDSNPPGNLFPSAPKSLSETASTFSGEAAASLSDDDDVEAISSAQPADPSHSITVLTIPSGAGNDVVTPQTKHNELGSDATISLHHRLRRRKLPRSMIPVIFTQLEEEDDAGDRETPMLKKPRLA